MTTRMFRLACAVGAAAWITACSEQAPPPAESAPTPAESGPPAEAKVADPRWTWDLTELYPNVASWDAARKAVLEEAQQVAKLEGTLAQSPAAMLKVYEAVNALTKNAARVFVYASLGADEDVRNSEGQERRQLAQRMFSQVSESFSWMAPEITAMKMATIEAYIKREPKLESFRFSIEDSFRQKPHILSTEVEAVLASVGLLQGQPFNIYGTLANSDIPFPTITLSDGSEVTVNSQGYSGNRSNENRADRQAVFESFWSTWKDYKSSVGQTLSAHITSQVFSTKTRNYEDTLTRNLFSDALPREVYDTLVKVTNDNLDTLHRYLKLRAKVLGIKDLNYHDIYVDLVQPTRKFSIEETVRITDEAVKPLGDEYARQHAEAAAKRWMHVYPQPGKRSGAYMSGFAYDVHPYILLNHQDDFTSVSTYAHEWGHAMHQLLSNENQPWHLARFSIFTTETAAIANELLVQDYMLKGAQSDEERLFYLGFALERLRGTFSRQTMFSEFEGAIYAASERGEPLSGERITQIYADIVRRYHGHDQGVMEVPDLYTHEWMFVPHFYFNFYVFQYATSIAGAAYFVEQITADREDTRVQQTYLNMLKAGGSAHPYELFQQAGVDMASPEPYEALIRRMNVLLDEFEATWDRLQASRS